MTAVDTAGAPPGGAGGAGDAGGVTSLGELARAVAGPVICVVVIIGLLSAWVASGGAGTLTRVRIQVTLAAVPMRAFTIKASDVIGTERVYLDIRNLSSTPDELVAVRTPIATRVVFTEPGLGDQASTVSSLPIPANGTLALSPLGDGLVLEHPVPYEDRQSVPLTLIFRDAGEITIDAPVTAPGTP